MVAGSRDPELHYSALQGQRHESNLFVLVVVQGTEVQEQSTLGQWPQLELNEEELHPVMLLEGLGAHQRHRREAALFLHLVQ